MFNYSSKGKKFALVLGALFVFAAIPATVVLTLQGNPLVSKPHAATNATLSLSPASKSLTQGQTYSFQIRENSGTDTVNGVQANITYDASKLQYVGMSETASAFGLVVQTNSATAGLLQLARAVNPGDPPVQGDQLVTTVKFKSKVPSGSTTLSFAAGSQVASSVDNTNILGTTSGANLTLLDSHYWNGWDIARAVVLKNDGSGGYVLDGWGGLHAFGEATPILNNTHAYWQGWDIARDVALRPDGSSGYILDAYGGLHAFGGAPAIAHSSHSYWPGWKIARSVVLLPDGSGGYILDGWGGLHRFGSAVAISNSSHNYWKGWDIARGVALLSTSTSSSAQGYILDGWGGVHTFGGAPAISNSSHDYWQGWDIANAIAVNSNGGYTLDGWGGIHRFGSATNILNSSHSYWQRWDIARDFALMPNGSSGFILDGYGGLHPFGGATPF